MNIETRIEKIQNPNEITYKRHCNCDVVIRDLSTCRTCKVIENLIPAMDEVLEVVHYRKRKSLFYRTIIIGKRFSVDVQSGLGSGYDGSGPTGFYHVLYKLGFAEEIARIAYDRKHDNAVITLKKII